MRNKATVTLALAQHKDQKSKIRKVVIKGLPMDFDSPEIFAVL
jgi:hypothetical protein